MSDPQLRESGRSPLSGSTAAGGRDLRDLRDPLAPADPPRPYAEEIQGVPKDVSLAPPLVGDTIRQRKDDLERRLATANRLLALAQKRAADLTVDELMDLWQNL